MAPWLKSPFKSPKSIRSIKVGLAKLRGWSRRRDSVCSTGSVSSPTHSNHPLWGASKSSSSGSSDPDGSPGHGGGASNFYSPARSLSRPSLLSGDEAELKDDVFTPECKRGIPISRNRPHIIRRGSAPTVVRLPRPPESMISPIPDRLRNTKSSHRRGSAPEPDVPRHASDLCCEKRRSSAPTVVRSPPPKDEEFVDIPPRLEDPKNKYRRGSAPTIGCCSTIRTEKKVSTIPPHVKESCQVHHNVGSPKVHCLVSTPNIGYIRSPRSFHRCSSPNIRYLPRPRRKQRRGSTPTIDHVTNVADISGSFNLGSPNTPNVAELMVNHAVSSLRFPQNKAHVSSSSWCFHTPDVIQPHTPDVNGRPSELESKRMCDCGHKKNKDNELSPSLSGPVDVTITLPRTPRKSPVAEDTFKVSSTVICDDGTTRCGPTVRSKSHQTQSADGLLTLSDFDSPNVLPISVPKQNNDIERMIQDMKRMGINDEFHQKAILVCIDQLQNGRHDGDSTGPGVGDCSTPASHHTLRNHSFHDLHRCDKCGLYLRGFIHQGQFCQDCGLIAHRTCAATGLPPCVRQSSSYFRRILLSSVFGLSLCTQFNPGESMSPLLLVRCCEELLYRAKSDSSLDLYRLYRTPPQQDSLAKLREACDDDISNADLSLHEPHVIAYLIKRYLRELPEPVIPENCYDRFIGAAQIDNDEQCARSITQLVKELNPHHYYTLKFLMTHFLQLCQLQVSRGNKDPPTLLIQSLCHVLLRPPWDKIVELARNTDYHMRIVEMLLLKVDWGEKVPSFPSAPALPPRIRPRQSVQSYSSSGYDPVDPIMSPSSPPMGMPIMPIAGPLPVTNIPSDAPKALQESEWYWGNITRDDVNVLMRDAKDGTFLVRDASTGNNEYTLTVRKGGSNKLIKICHRNGMYGFIEPLNFNSVVDLINYCQQQNLSQFNKALDIKLLYPVSRNTYGDESESRGLKIEEILGILADYNKQYKEKTIQWNICYEKQQLASQEIQNYRQALESFNEMIAWLQDHLDLHDKLKLEAQPHEINELSVNRGVLQERIEQVRDAQSKYTIHLNNTNSECRVADRTCNSMKMECSQLMKMRDQLKNVLLSRGISADMIDKWLEQADPHQPQPIQPLAELHNESLWLHENCTREEAQNILRGRPDGTFLIRMAQNGGYALSIACNKEVQHCRIYQGENGFGFAEPFLIYATLRDLVLHYSKNSLLMHNDLLNTTLNFPARPGS